jgi:hypothetical protein
MAERVARLIGWLAAAFFLVFGLWAFAAPANFYKEIAVFAPYNRHFLHDSGAFQIGIGAALVLGLLGWDGLGTAIGGAAAGSVLHVVAHLMDTSQGGRSTDPFGLGLLALALLWATWALRPGAPRSDTAPATGRAAPGVAR